MPYTFVDYGELLRHRILNTWIINEEYVQPFDPSP